MTEDDLRAMDREWHATTNAYAATAFAGVALPTLFAEVRRLQTKLEESEFDRVAFLRRIERALAIVMERKDDELANILNGSKDWLR